MIFRLDVLPTQIFVTPRSPILSLQSRASVYFGPWWHERFPQGQQERCMSHEAIL
jgi:hypothetical protein